MKHLIQFVDLDELLDDAIVGDVLRIASLMDQEENDYIAYVTVRQIQRDNVLSWAYVVGKTAFFYGEDNAEQMDELAETSRQMEEKINAYITDALGLIVSPGIIDIEDREVMFGVWRWWEEQNYNQDSEEEREESHPPLELEAE